MSVDRAVLFIGEFDDVHRANAAHRVRAMARLGVRTRSFDLNAKPGLVERFRAGDLPKRIERALDEHAPDLTAFRAGLVSHERHADQLLRELFDFFGRLRDLDAATLPAAAGMNLGFDDGDLSTEPFRGIDRFSRSERHLAARDGNAETREHGLGLILVDFHRRTMSPLVTNVCR